MDAGRIEVVIGACGLCSSLGANLEENLRSIFNSTDFFEKNDVFESPKYSEKLVGVAHKIPDLKLPKSYSKCAKMLCAAVDEALQSAKIPEEIKEETGVFLGTSIGGIFQVENELLNFRQNLTDKIPSLRDYECSALADIVAKTFEFKGMRMSFSTACSSSGLALDAALKAIKQGECKAAIVCGVDALSRITVNGFGSLLLLSKSKSKPFDKFRDGINLGEGAGAILLLEKSCAKSLGIKPIATLNSTACSCDAYHATAPHPEGEGASQAMSKALECAKISPNAISAIFAHGTGTDGNDSAEFKAMQKVFGEKIPPYLSIKGLLGHTLGASGIINAIVSAKCVENNFLPKSAGFGVAPEYISQPPNLVSQNIQLDCVLTSSLGFGGNNASAVISKFKSEEIDLAECENFAKEFYLKSVGLVSPLGNSESEFFKNLSDGKSGNLCDCNSILKEIPPLKKRRFARMQQMALESAKQALLNQKFDEKDTCVCFATGLGMTQETSKFIENVIESREEKPMPSSFTNSVHNAPSSAIANSEKIKGLNSAITAKEASFEAALMQTKFEFSSSSASSSLIVATDEKSSYAQIFEKSAKYSQKISDMSEVAISYFASTEKDSAFAKILGVKIRNKLKSPNEEFEKIKQDLLSFNLDSSEIKMLFVPQILNDFEACYYENLIHLFDDKCAYITSNKVSTCYVNSAYFPLLAKSFGKGKYLQINLTSTGQIAICALEIL